VTPLPAEITVPQPAPLTQLEAKQLLMSVGYTPPPQIIPSLLVALLTFQRSRLDLLHILTGAKGTSGHASKVLNPNMKGVEFMTGIISMIHPIERSLTAMIFGYKEKPNFTVANESEISTAPKVDFNAPAPAAPAK